MMLAEGKKRAVPNYSRQPRCLPLILLYPFTFSLRGSSFLVIGFVGRIFVKGVEFADFSAVTSFEWAVKLAIVAEPGELQLPFEFVLDQCPVYNEQKRHDDQAVIIADQRFAVDGRLEYRFPECLKIIHCSDFLVWNFVGQPLLLFEVS